MKANHSIYTTVQGDAWDSIAYKLFGDEMQLQSILALNSDLADILIFPADVKIKVPTTASKKIKTIIGVPWA